MILEPTADIWEVEKSFRKGIPVSILLATVIPIIMNDYEMIFWCNMGVVIGYSLIYIPYSILKIKSLLHTNK